jgi:hypothetical protein
VKKEKKQRRVSEFLAKIKTVTPENTRVEHTVLPTFMCFYGKREERKGGKDEQRPFKRIGTYVFGNY